ncbi:MAG TPA: cytochrome c biogenesis protein CcdA [Bacilli bacterium]|nr:cytochrome c biogenesis protein CcdA [Bacilli bacterium]
MFDTANPNFIIAFIAGLLSFVSPCCLPLYPSYLSYITGVSYDKMQAERGQGAIRRKALLHAVFFVIGFSIIFIALGLSAQAFGWFFREYSRDIAKIGGVIIIVMGLFMAGVLKIPFFMRMKQMKIKARAGYFGAILVGISFAAGWTPCIGPILASVVALAATDPVSGWSMLLFYSLGFAIPFLVMAYTLGSVRWLLKYTELLAKIGGVGMVIMGLLLVTDTMTSIIIWLSRLFGGFTGF